MLAWYRLGESVSTVVIKLERRLKQKGAPPTPGRCHVLISHLRQPRLGTTSSQSSTLPSPQTESGNHERNSDDGKQIAKNIVGYSEVAGRGAEDGSDAYTRSRMWLLEGG